MFARDVLAGYYGHGNFGDDLFCEVLVAAMRETGWARPVLSRNRDERWAKLRRNLRAVGNIARARSLTLGGGSILGYRPHFGVREVEGAAAALRGFPWCAVGVGVMAGATARPEEMVRRMSWVGLRSERDYAALHPLAPGKVHYMSDIAYAAPHHLGLSVAAGRDVTIIPAGVGALGKASADGAHLAAWLAGNMLPFTRRGCTAKVLLLQPGNARDEALCDQLVAALRAQGVAPRLVVHAGAKATLAEIAASAFVFTDRLHGGICAHLSGVPFRLSLHHDKCRDLLADLHHPDAAGPSYAADAAGAGVAAVEDWSAGQGAEVRRHGDLARAGIEGWLAHLRQRVGA